MRRTVVFGKIIENVYDAALNQKKFYDAAGVEKTVYIGKPQIVKSVTIKDWEEICNFEGEPTYNHLINYYEYINISNEEEVRVLDKIFRADLNEVHLFTNKVIGENDKNKEEATALVEKHIKLFNKMMIESNDKMKAYCDVHKLSYEDTDCIELFKLVFPNERYEIIDGVMIVKCIWHNDSITCLNGITDAKISCTSIEVPSTLTTDNTLTDAIACAKCYY